MAETLSVYSRAFLGARCAVILLPWLIHLLVADIALSTLLPVSIFWPDLCYNVSSHIAESVWRRVQHIFTRTNGAQITVSGLKSVPVRENAIVVSNHIEWADFYLLQELAERSGMLGRCRWFAKRQLKWVPFLGWGLWAMGMPLVSRNWTQDQKEMDRVFDGLLQRRWPMCMPLLYTLRHPLPGADDVVCRAGGLQRRNSLYSP